MPLRTLDEQEVLVENELIWVKEGDYRQVRHPDEFIPKFDVIPLFRLVKTNTNAPLCPACKKQHKPSEASRAKQQGIAYSICTCLNGKGLTFGIRSDVLKRM